MLNSQGKNYGCRDEEIRDTLTLEECIRRITKVYGWEYDKDTPTFDGWDQLLACEAVAGSTPVREEYIQDKANESVLVSGDGVDNDGCKESVNFELTSAKQTAIAKLKECRHTTPPIQIEEYLLIIFREWKSNPKHWLYIAQHYNPRAIVRTIEQMVKIDKNGQVSFKNPSAYFTDAIKYRKKRRLRNKQIIEAKNGI